MGEPALPGRAWPSRPIAPKSRLCTRRLQHEATRSRGDSVALGPWHERRYRHTTACTRPSQSSSGSLESRRSLSLLSAPECARTSGARTCHALPGTPSGTARRRSRMIPARHRQQRQFIPRMGTAATPHSCGIPEQSCDRSASVNRGPRAFTVFHRILTDPRLPLKTSRPGCVLPRSCPLN